LHQPSGDAADQADVRGKDPELAFWEGNVRTANVLNGAITAINGVYFLATRSTGDNRGLLLLMTAMSAAGQAWAVVSGAQRRLLDSPRRDFAFGVWASLGIAFVVVGSILDGGLESPLLWLFPLGTVFCALVHPPRLVIVQGLGTVAGYFLVALADDGFDRMPATVLLEMAYLAVVAALSAEGAAARWRYHRSLAELTERDPLTGLANHRVFFERLQLELDAAARKEETVSVVLVDLDRFKQINDRHGHLVGDAALRAVADALRFAARAPDVVARVGGEEFAIVLRGTDGGGALTFAERTRQSIESIVDPVQLTVSMGVSCSYGAASTAEELYDAADRAMYRAKGAGRNRVFCAV
jgi:diguanylate cyclase (GGDEF)-like protein